MWKTWSYLVVGCLLLLLTGAALAQNGTDRSNDQPDSTPEATAPIHVTNPDDVAIVYNTPYSATINNDSHTHHWSLETLAADRIRVEVTRTDGNLIPQVRLDAANGSAIENRTADETGAVVIIERAELPGAGNYRVTVGRDGDAAGRSIRTAAPNAARDRIDVEFFRLPADGEYQFIVYRDRGQAGRTTGSYSMRITTAE